MKNEHDSPENVEQRLQRFFDKEAEELKAPSNLWAKLEPRLDDTKKTAPSSHQTKRLRHWLVGPRLIGVASALAVVLVLLATGLVWWTGDNGKVTTSTHQSASAVNSAVNQAYNNQVILGAGAQGPNGSEGSATYGLSQRLPAGKGMPAPVPSPVPAPTLYANPTFGLTGSGVVASGAGFGPNAAPDQAATLLDTAQRQVISTASISLEVQTVDTAVSQIRAIAESLGGFLEQMSSSGGNDTAQATATIRVPQAQFFAALDRLQALGKVQSQNMGSQDVTEQYIDLNARLKSAQEEEQSLLLLLSKTVTLADIIILEKELSQVRSNIENIQGQLNYIERRVDLATIDVSLSIPATPVKVVGQAPSGSMTVAVHNVDNTIASVKGLVSSVNGEMGQVNISVNEGNETATLSFQVYRANFDQVMASIGRQGKTQQKYIQEGTTPKGATVETAEKPDAYVSLTLIETNAHGFWTSGNIVVISITGSIILVALLVFLFIANRKGLLQKSTEQTQV